MGLGPVVGDPRPRMRGWLHAGALPLSIAAGIVLITLAPTSTARVAAWCYVVPSWLLFGVSAAYHLGHWRPATALLMKRLDHSNIYLIIAGSYTPFVLLGLRGALEISMVAGVWVGALAGVAFRVLVPDAPRWLYVSLYVLVPCAPVFVLPSLLHRVGITVVVLVLAGALVYIAGGLVYGLRRPNPSPAWFGFHEVFHGCTLVAYAVQYVAISLVVYRS
jgi:hemolysin III